MPPGWRPLADVAREAAAREGVTERTIRNRLLAVDLTMGGGLLRSFSKGGRGRWWVNLAKLEQARSGPVARSPELGWLTARVERLEQQVEALKAEHRRLKRQMAELERARDAMASPFAAGADGRAWELREAG